RAPPFGVARRRAELDPEVHMTFFKLSTTSCDTVEADDGIVQPDLRLWPDRDPNLHRIGIYKFEVAADALKAALERVIEPNEHDNQRVEFELSDSSLHCAVKMKNGEFGAVAAVTLREQTKTGAAPVKFSIDALRIYKVSKFVLGRLAFEFNQDTAKLKVSQVGSIFSCTFDVI